MKKPFQSLNEILGIDLGHTIVSGTSVQKLPFPDALRVIKRLVDERFGPQKTFIVSKVNEHQQVRAQRWLTETGFHEATGIPANHVEWCPERRDKAPICKRLGITHFIDDRPEVHFHLQGIVEHRFLFQGVPEDIERYSRQNGILTRVNDWSQVERMLLPM